MRPIVVAMLGALLLGACQSMEPNPRIAIVTDHGRIEAEIYLDRSPVSAAAFLANVDQGVYNAGRAEFYRVVHMGNQPRNKVKIEVVQGGVDRDTGDTRRPYIPHETTAVTGLTHRDGSLSLARDEPGTANTEFSICIGPQPELDFGGRRNPDGQGFAVIGQVLEGMDVVRRVQQFPETGQYLDQAVPIRAIQRVTPGTR